MVGLIVGQSPIGGAGDEFAASLFRFAFDLAAAVAVAAAAVGLKTVAPTAGAETETETESVIFPIETIAVWNWRFVALCHFLRPCRR